MTVYRKNIVINVGETFSEDLTLLSADGNGVVDLTGFTAQSKLRKSPTNYRFADIQVGIKSAADGLVNISIASSITKFLQGGRHVYDVEISFTDSNAQTVVERVLEGTLTVTPSVT